MTDSSKPNRELNSAPDSEIDVAEAARLRKLLIGALDPEHDRLPDVLRGVQRKLRERSLCAGALSVYLRSDRFSGERFHESRTAGFAVATGDAREVAGMALRLVREMFREGSPVKKAGVEAWDLVPEGAVQGHLFDAVDRPRQASLQRAVDGLVRRWGSDVLELAVQGGGKSWSTRQEHRSRRYTTDWNDLLVVDMDRSHRIAPAAG